MIASAFQSVNFPILPLIQVDDKGKMSLYQRNPKLFTPRDFDYSPYFDIIKYPFIDHTNPASYRYLPWKHHAHQEDLTLAKDFNADDLSSILSQEGTSKETKRN